MDLEQLQDLADKKLKINDTELDLESLKTPQLHNEFLKHLTKFKLLLSKAQIEYYTQRKQKWEYYTDKAPAEVYALKPFNLKLLKTDVDKYLEADPELAKYKQKVDYIQTVVDFLDRTIKQISNRGFQIKNAIDWRKFTSGAI
jgi:hypothetical protein